MQQMLFNLPGQPQRRAVFLDRDGVINENRIDHVKSWEEFRFIPGALAALRWLRMSGFCVFIVTNQAVIGRGIVSQATIEALHARMIAQIVRHGGWIHDLRYCPHDPHAGCTCRKPQPGMLLDLAARWQVDLSRSYLIGDALTDIAAAQAAGCRGVLVRTGRGNEQLALPEAQQCRITHVAADLISGVEWLFRAERLTLSPAQDAAYPSGGRQAIRTPNDTPSTH